jgi:hypothetical protein
MDSDGSGAESDEGSDTDDEGEKKSNVPDWARGQTLKDALERQYGLQGGPPMDPDSIFPEVDISE